MATERRCAVNGCTGDMSETFGTAVYCPRHSRSRSNDTRKGTNTFRFRCEACPFEADLPKRCIKRRFCQKCSDERERLSKRKAVTGTAGASAANASGAEPAE